MTPADPARWHAHFRDVVAHGRERAERDGGRRAPGRVLGSRRGADGGGHVLSCPTCGSFVRREPAMVTCSICGRSRHLASVATVKAFHSVPAQDVVLAADRHEGLRRPMFPRRKPCGKGHENRDLGPCDRSHFTGIFAKSARTSRKSNLPSNPKAGHKKGPHEVISMFNAAHDDSGDRAFNADVGDCYRPVIGDRKRGFLFITRRGAQR
jgi:hypothetical protein